MWLMGASSRHIAALENQFLCRPLRLPHRPRAGGKNAGDHRLRRDWAARGPHRPLGLRHARLGRLPLHAGSLREARGRSHDAVKAEYGLDACTNNVDYVLENSDIVSLHLSRTREPLFHGRPAAGANAARRNSHQHGPGLAAGRNALYDALAGGMLSAAGLDVFESEPYRPHCPDRDLRTLENVLLTPHIASNTREANERMARVCLDNIRNFFAGRLESLNRVDEVL